MKVVYLAALGKGSDLGAREVGWGADRFKRERCELEK